MAQDHLKSFWPFTEKLDMNYLTDPNIKRGNFPDGFMFGVGSSSYQIEGAWNADGKGLHIWDCFSLRHPERIQDGSNACVTVDSYHRIKEDVRLLKQMGVTHYRFSICWSRILPGGKVSMGKNLEGIKYYNQLIDELQLNNIEPFVTLFHWDVPNALEEEYMGLLSPKIVKDFEDYVEICFWEFGDRVKNWVTLNEPFRFMYDGYVTGKSAPGRGGGDKLQEEGDPATEPYLVAYHLLRCHAAAYKKYQDYFKDVQKGKVGITLDVTYYKPYRTEDPMEHENDVKAVNYAFDFTFGLYMEPLTSGNWPKSVQTFATLPSAHHPQGRTLRVFTDEEKQQLVNSYDFLGINYYTSNYAKLNDGHYLDPKNPPADGFATDCQYEATGQDPSGKDIGERAFEHSWVYLCAYELVDLMEHIKKTYNVKKYIVITENGAPQENDDKKTYEQVRDDKYRLKYLKWHLEAIRRVNYVKKLKSEGGLPFVMGYFAWSFTDSYEWSFGYTTRFGMNYIDYKNNLQRYPKNSTLWFYKFLSEKLPGKKSAVVLGKRSLTMVEQEDEEMDEPINGEPVKAEKAIESVQKLKKAKA